MTSGLAWKRGLMDLNKSICWVIVYPHDSEISSMNKIAAFRCARAVTAYISIVFLWSSG